MHERATPRRKAARLVQALSDARELSVGDVGVGEELFGSSFLYGDEVDWSAVIRADTLSESVYLLAAQVWALQGHEHVALELYWAASELGQEQAILDYAECLMWLGERREAFEILTGLADASGGMADEATSLLMSARLEDGFSVDNIDAIQKLRPGAKRRPFLRLQLAKLLLVSNGEDEAVKILHELSTEGDAEAAITLGNFLWDVSGDVARAEAAYEQGAKAGDAHCWYNLGQLQLRDQRTSEGLASLRAAASLGDGAAEERLRELGEW